MQAGRGMAAGNPGLELAHQETFNPLDELA
jgi:hypothetical protein